MVSVEGCVRYTIELQLETGEERKAVHRVTTRRGEFAAVAIAVQHQALTEDVQIGDVRILLKESHWEPSADDLHNYWES